MGQRLVTPVMLLGRGTGLPLRGGGERRTGWPPPSTPRSLPRGRRRPRKPRSSSAGGLLPFASPSAPCPASRRLILALHAEEINSRKPQSPSLTNVMMFLPVYGLENLSLIPYRYRL